jgi:hypothetical protein
MVRLDLRLREALLTVAVVSASAGCVDAYGGSHITVDFSPDVLVPSGGSSAGADVPAGAYFALYGNDEVVDDNGVVVENYAFEITRLDIHPLIDLASPCFIELEDTQFPGLHVTQFGAAFKKSICDRLSEAADCFDDPFDPPSGATENDITDVLGANARMNHLASYQSGLKVVSTFSDFVYPAQAADCSASGSQIPPPDCVDDASNEQRLRVCREFWADNPDFYEGSDKVFSLPLNGTYLGLVDGSNPVNGAPIGGATVFVDSAVRGFDSYSFNYQFHDFDGDGSPDYPATFLDTHEESNIGYVWLQGRPDNADARGVIKLFLFTPFDPDVFAQVAIFANLGEDDVTF